MGEGGQGQRRQDELSAMNTVPTRVALVTGASSGLGFDIARRLAQDGRIVVMTGTRLAHAERASASLREGGLERTVPMEVDVTSESSVQALLHEIEQRFGRLDVLVNNAGIAPRVNGAKARVEDTPLELWNRTLSTNLTGAFLVTRAAIPLMKRHRWGRIVFINSRAARTRSTLASAYYAASKAGLLGFARIVADEVGRDGICVNTVAPTRISTPLAATVADPHKTDREFIEQTAVGRLGLPADVSAAVSYLASEEAGFISGAVLDVTGGQFMP
jgi:3-oxoacyl-[acyl-carrier protein] reductase